MTLSCANHISNILSIVEMSISSFYARDNYKYFKEFAALTVSVEEALAYFATHADEVLCLFGRYCEESKLDLQQVA